MTDSTQQPSKPEGIPFWIKYGAPGIILMLIGVFIALLISNHQMDILSHHPVSFNNQRLIYLDTDASRFILRNGMPILDRNSGEDDPFTLMHVNVVGLYWRLAANLKTASPVEILKTQLPLLALTNPPPIPLHQLNPIPSSPQLPNPLPVAVSPGSLAVDPAVFIYHTHTSESYLPVSGQDHCLNGKGDIVQVGAYLQEVLENKYNLKCLHNETIHDQFPFRESYQRSQRSLLKYLGEYPSINVVLDVHRDATPGIASEAVINGKKAATIMIVVGSDKMGLAHPNWHKNLNFATKLNEAMNLYYPGLSSGIVTSDARYNQHLNDHALIIEFGDQKSDLKEVFRAVDLFAEILVRILSQEQIVTAANTQ